MGVARVVPVTQRGALEFPEDQLKIIASRQFMVVVAIFEPQADVVAFGRRQ